MTESPPPPDQGWSDRPTSSEPAPASWPPYAAPASTTTAVATAQRPGMVTAAGIILIVLGAITLLFGAIFLLGAAIFTGAAGSIGEATDAPAGAATLLGAAGGLLIVLAVLVLAWGVLDIVVGIKAMGGRSWARITGIVLGVIGALLSLGSLAGSLEGGVQGVIINIALAAAYAFVIFALATSGRWFAARST